MNRLIPFFLVASLCASAFAQGEVAKAKALVGEGKCAEAVPLLQKVSKSSFRKHEGAQASVMPKFSKSKKRPSWQGIYSTGFPPRPYTFISMSRPSAGLYHFSQCVCIAYSSSS
jgi:hypothetical protein